MSAPLVDDPAEMIARCKQMGWKVRDGEAGHRVVTNPRLGKSTTINLTPTAGRGSAYRAKLDRIGFTDAWRTHQEERERARRVAEVAAQQVNALATQQAAARSQQTPTVGSHGMFTVSELVTFERAKQILAEANEGAGQYAQRPEKEARIRKYEGQMRAGNWYESPQGLVFGAKVGDKWPLYDGQSRLEAQVRVGIDLTYRVTYNCPAELMPTFDTGKVRTYADNLHIHHMPGGTIMGSVAKLLYCYALMRDPDRPDVDNVSWPRWNRFAFTNLELLEFQRSPEMAHLYDFFPAGTALTVLANGARLNTASGIAFRWLAEKEWPEGIEKLRAFSEGVRSGRNIVGAPLRLRDWAADVRARKARIVPAREIHLLLLLRCWRAYAVGNRIQGGMSWTRPGTDVPAVMPLPYRPDADALPI